MHRSLYTLLIVAGFVGGLLGCSSGKQVAVTVSTATSKVQVDEHRQGHVKATFQIPDGWLSSRSRLIIIPRLRADDGQVLEQYEPVALDAPIYSKKLYRRQVLEGYVDSLAEQAHRVEYWRGSIQLTHETDFILPPEVQTGYLDAVIAEDGCGCCPDIDTLFIANILAPAPKEVVMPPKDTFSRRWIQPKWTMQEKVMKGEGVASLQFIINRSDINVALGNNREELLGMEKKLAPVFGDSLATVTSLQISGMASADGSLAFNTQLAYQRAESAKQWLIDRMAIPVEVQAIMTAASRPEGWEPVLDAMREANDPDTEQVAEILSRYASSNDDVQEAYIRQLPCWNRIRDRYLQKDRKVEYVYTYTLKSFTTDEELLRMYRQRPDAFSEEEFLRVADLMPTLSEKVTVYTTLLRYYPQSEIGRNNLAVLEHELKLQSEGKGGQQ